MAEPDFDNEAEIQIEMEYESRENFIRAASLRPP